jgi:hypothetical protein
MSTVLFYCRQLLSVGERLFQQRDDAIEICDKGRGGSER